MAYRMAHITQRPDSSHHMFRLRTPANVLAAGAMGKRILFDIPAFMGSEPLLVRTTVGADIKFSLRTRVEEVAEFRRSVALAELNKFFAAVRRGPQPLSQMQLLGLARSVHELYVEAFQDEPGTQDVWIAHKALNRAVAEGRVSTVEPIVPGQMPHDQESASSLFGDDWTAGIDPAQIGSDEADRGRFSPVRKGPAGRQAKGRPRQQASRRGEG